MDKEEWRKKQKEIEKKIKKLDDKIQDLHYEREGLWDELRSIITYLGHLPYTKKDFTFNNGMYLSKCKVCGYFEKGSKNTFSSLFERVNWTRCIYFSLESSDSDICTFKNCTYRKEKLEKMFEFLQPMEIGVCDGYDILWMKNDTHIGLVAPCE